MSDNEQEPTYLEFEDPDDHESNTCILPDRRSFKLTIQPEMYLVAMIKNPKHLEPDVLPAVRQLMYGAYLQGKRVGNEKVHPI